MNAICEPTPLFGEPADNQRLSVWTTAQTGPRAQRKGRYLPESDAHPAKMFPAIAAHAVDAYTAPGDLVVDPMCGIGTTLVEAMHADRMAVGVEYEKRWADLAARNVEHAVNRGAPGYATVVRGDARDIENLVGSDARGKAALVLTSPPYGPVTHGHVRISRDSGTAGIEKWNHAYSDDPDNLARQSVEELMAGFTEILCGCAALLKPGGFLVITARPFRRTGRMVDIPSMATQAAMDAGFTLHERCVALLAAATGDGLMARSSFFQLVNSRKAFAAGHPTHVSAHEDVIVARLFPKSANPSSESAADEFDGSGCGCVPMVRSTDTEGRAAA